MRADIINTKLAKNESIQNVINVHENHNKVKDLSLSIECNIIENLNDILTRLDFPIEKVIIYDDNNNKLNEYANYHILGDASTAMYLDADTFIQETVYVFV